METRKVKFGIIGFGIFGEKRLIPGFQGSKFAELTAITKRTMSAAHDKAEKYNIPYAYDNIENLLNNGEIEAVFIATPNNIHLENVIAAAQAGKHIIVEKPMGMTVNECEQMIQASKDNKVKLMIAHCMRYNTTVLKLKEMVDTGEIGKIVSMSGKFYYDGTRSNRKWLLDVDIAGGGPIADLGVHLIDTLRFISGKEIINLKFCKENTIGGTVESKSQIILEMEDCIDATIGVGFEGNYYTSLEIVGSNYAVHAPFFNQINRDISLSIFKNMETISETVKNQNCYVAEIDAFAQSILNGTPAPISAEEGLINQKILDKLLYS